MAESIRLSELPLLDSRGSEGKQVSTDIYEVLFDFRTKQMLSSQCTLGFKSTVEK